MKGLKKTLCILLCMLMLLSVLPMGISAQSTDGAILENWSAASAKFSSYTYSIFTESDENGNKVVKTEGFDYSLTDNNGIKVVTPSYDVFPGCHGLSMIKSEYKTILSGLCVEIMPDEFDFIPDVKYGNNFSIVWSDEPLQDIKNDCGADMFFGDGFRNLIPDNTQALCINIGNTNLEGSALVASDVSIIYYDGSFKDSLDRPGFRWTFTQKDGEHEYENIDISNGLRVSLRANDTYGYIVNINGKDYYRAEDVAYTSDNKIVDVDLSGLSGKGYLTVGAVAGSDNCNYTVTKINNMNAANWRGQSKELENWSAESAKFSSRTELLITKQGENGEKVPRVEGFEYTVTGNNAIKVITPPYDEFAGIYGTSMIKSDFTTALIGLSVEIMPDEFDFAVNEQGYGNNFSIVWSNEPLKEITEDINAAKLAGRGFRNLLPDNSQALCINIGNTNPDGNALTASDVSIIYYDGSLRDPMTDEPGNRWSFTQKDDGHEYESIDISKGLRVSIRENDTYGYIVNINGKDYYLAEDVAYYNGSDGVDIDLSGLSGEGYLTVGAVAGGDNCNYTVTKVNNMNAAEWQGQYSRPELENWTVDAVKFSSGTGMVIAPSGNIKTEGFTADVVDGSLVINTPDDDIFPGSYGTTLLTSKNTTPLAGLEVCIDAGDFGFVTNNFGITDHISVLWSEGKPLSFTTDMTSADITADGMRAMIDKDGGKALAIDITNSYAIDTLAGSQLRVTYYDGSYICDGDNRAGYRWVFADANIDLTNGLDIKVRCDGEYGFIVTVNGVDFCAAENVTYFDENIGAKVDLTGLSEAENGYVTVATVTAHRDNTYSHRVVSVNGTDAADWKGERNTPVASAEGITVKVENLHDIRDFFIAKGEYTTYSEVKANHIVRVSAERIGFNTEYSYNVPSPGMHTVYVRYADGDYKVLYVDVKVAEPTFSKDGLRLTLGNLEGIKVIRTAYGEYNKVADIKRAEGARAFTAKYITDPDNYIVQYRENGIVTVAVCYNNGYTVIEHFEIVKKSPVFTQDGNKVTFTELDDLKVVRYAKGEYTTSSQIKNAAGSVAITPKKIVDGAISVTLPEGTYTFCVQYNDESYNYYVVNIA